MSYEVRVARQAEGYFNRLDRQVHARMLRRLNQIAQDPYGPYTKSLVNAASLRSARVGDWRIIFAVDNDKQIVDVSAIGPRGGIYRRL